MEHAVSHLTQTFTFPSPAKINLFLHINSQRPDGYHELQTLFQFVDYGDDIHISTTRDNSITLENNIDGVKQEDNLIYKAAKLLQPYNKNQRGVRIAIEKRLPMGGGLGGGSSNAATILVALNKLWQCQLNIDDLAQLGLSLGADVPVFVRGFAAFAEGVGEKLQPAFPEEYWYLITKPNCHISTANVFTSPDLPRNTAKIIGNDFSFDKNHNDCEVMVRKHYPEVAKLLAWLVEYAPSRMTGTGACVFSLFDTEQEARRIESLLPKGIQGFVAKGVNQSPLHAAVDAI